MGCFFVSIIWVNRRMNNYRQDSYYESLRYRFDGVSFAWGFQRIMMHQIGKRIYSFASDAFTLRTPLCVCVDVHWRMCHAYRARLWNEIIVHLLIMRFRSLSMIAQKEPKIGHLFRFLAFYLPPYIQLAPCMYQLFLNWFFSVHILCVTCLLCPMCVSFHCYRVISLFHHGLERRSR